MKAVIMAGGFGTRLRPLTETLPKPCVTVVGVPCIVRIVRSLAAIGIREFHVSLFYLPEQVKTALSKAEFGDLTVVYHEEKLPLGTAGSVRNCLPQTDEDFIIVSGDAVFDFDLSAAVAYHQFHGGPITILSSRVSDPGEYGVMLCDTFQRVVGFYEKPDWPHAYSDTVNTGIYIASPSFLDYIPDGVSDFSSDVFPAMLQSGIPVYSFELSGYWCDVGSVPSYLECNRHILHGGETAILSPVGDDTVVESPCYIGKNVILNHCHIGPFTVIEDGCVLNFARVEGSILHVGVQCDPGATVRNAVLCKNARLHGNVRVGDECVIGSDCDIGNNTTVSAGIRIYPSNCISAHSFVAGNVHHKLQNLYPEEGKIYFPFGEDFGGSMIYEIGRSLALLFDGDIAVGRGEQKDASCAMTFCGGVLAGGKNVFDTGVNDLSRFRFSVRNYAFCGGAYFERNYSNLILRIYDGDGMPLCPTLAKKFLRLLKSESNCGAQDGMYRVFRGGAKSYLSFLRSFGLPQHLLVRVNSSPILSPLLPNLSENAARERMRVGAEWVRIERSDGEPFDEARIRLAACVALGLRQSPVFVPEDFPSVGERTAELFGFRLIRVAEGEESYRKCFPLTDPNVQALLILGVLEREHCTFDEWCRRLPFFAIKQRDVTVSVGRSSVMRLLVQAGGELHKGVYFRDPVGTVQILPKENADAFRVISEAADAEQAEELCEFYTMKLKGLKPD